MMEHSASAPERVRECDHSTPVERCAHFGDDSIYLDDWSYEEAEIGRLVACRYDVWTTFQGPAFYSGNDYDAALAAFHEAEEALLRGGES